MKISVIIPNFNGVDLLKENLPKVLSAAVDAEFVVVDDASTDDSLTVIKTQFPQVKIIAREKNEGFASTVNVGVRNSSGDLILLLNSDVVPKKDFLKYLIPHFKNPQVFAVGCLQKSSKTDGAKIQGRGIGRFERGFLIHGPGSLDKTNTLWVFGGAGMFRKKIWEKLGGMDTLYNPFYWEDIDLSYRALKAGYKLVFEPKSIVIHDQEKGAIRSLYTPQQVKTIAYRNQILFVWLNITSYSLLLNHYLYLSYHLVSAVLSGNLPFLKAFIDASKSIPSVLLKRSTNRKWNTLSDEKIISDLNE